MLLTREQIDYLAGLAQVYGSAHLGDQDEDGAVLMAPPPSQEGAGEAARWVAQNGRPESPQGIPAPNAPGPGPEQAPPLSPHGDFLRRWHSGQTGWPR